MVATRQRRIVLQLAAIAAAVLVYAQIQHARAARPTVPKVAVAASGEMTDGPAVAAARRIDELGFPAFAGWRIVGGRRDEVGGRHTATAVYARGRLRISYTIVSGKGHVNYADTTCMEQLDWHHPKIELNWIGILCPRDGELANRYVVAFKRNSRTVVLVGTSRQRSFPTTLRRLATAA